MSDDKRTDPKHPHPNPSPSQGEGLKIRNKDKPLSGPPERRLKSETSEIKGGSKDDGPYPGLRPYREDEKGKFFGRDTDTEILLDKVLTNRLTLLFAASGSGKSSLLQAAVIPHLKSKTGENLAVVYHIDWVSNPVKSVGDAVLAGLHEAELLPDDVGDEERGETLADLLGFCGLFVRPPLVLILDQFEEFFRYQRAQPSFQKFIDQLTVVVTNKALPVSLVISMREDFALELNAFKPRLPTILFENFYRLEKLGRRAVRDAIVIPAKQRGFKYEPELLDQLLTDLLSRELDRQPNSPVVEMLETVEPPYLQIVCARLWELNKDDPKQTLRLASYEKARRAQGILKNYLDGVLQQFSASEKQLASLAFDHLVSNRGVKMAYTAEALAETLRVDAGELGAVLKKLEGVRVLREMPREDALWYELYHDMFSGSIEDWNNVWKDRMRRRRAAKIAGGVVFGVAALFAGWNYYLNVSNYHFRLSPKLSSEQVEVWRGKPGSWDLFGVQGYVAETGVKRHELEPDKQFHTRLIGDYDGLQSELVGKLPIDERVRSYANIGEFEKSLGLAGKSINPNRLDLAIRVLPNLFEIKTSNAVRMTYDFIVELESETIINEIIRKPDGVVDARQLEMSFGIVLLDDFKIKKEKIFDNLKESEKLFWVNQLLMQIATEHSRGFFLEYLDSMSHVDNDRVFDVLRNLPETDSLSETLVSLSINDAHYYQWLALELIAHFQLRKSEGLDVFSLIEGAFQNFYENGDEGSFKKSIHSALMLKEKDTKSKLINMIESQLSSNSDISPELVRALAFFDRDKELKYFYYLFDESIDRKMIFLHEILSNRLYFSQLTDFKFLTELAQDFNILESLPVDYFKLFKRESVVPFLLDVVASKNIGNIKYIKDALIYFDVKESIPMLIDLLDLNSLKVSNKVIIINLLAHLGAKKAVPKLTKLYDETETDFDLKYSLVQALGDLKVSSYYEKIKETLFDGRNDGLANFNVIEALAKIDLEKTIPLLLGFVDSYDDNFRFAVVDLLKRNEDQLSEKALLSILNSKHEYIFAYFLNIVHNFDMNEGQLLHLKERAIKIFLSNKEPYLFDDDNYISIEDFLLKLKPRYLVPKILAMFNIEGHKVKLRCIRFLGKLKSKESIPLVIKELKNPDFLVRSEAAKALKRMGSSESIPSLLHSFYIYDEKNWSAIDALSLLDDKHLMPYFFPYFNDFSGTRSDQIMGESDGSNILPPIFSRIASGELLNLLLRQLKSGDHYINTPASIVALNLIKGSNLTGTEKNILHKALGRVNKLVIRDIERTLEEKNVPGNERNSSLSASPIDPIGLESKPLTLFKMSENMAEMEQAYIDWRIQRDAESLKNTGFENLNQEIEKPDLSNPAPFIYEYAYAIAHESEADGIKLLGHNLYKVREAAARGLANSDALNVNLLKKLEKAWLATKDPIERQGIYHAIDIALLAIEGVGYETELKDLIKYEQELIDNKEERSIASIKPRVEWTKIQLQWRVDANKELEELAARQLPKLLKEYCLNEDGTDIPETECTIAH